MNTGTTIISGTTRDIGANTRAHAGVGANATVGTVRLRLTRRGRVVLTTLAATPLVAAALFFSLGGGIANAAGENDHPEHFSSVTVGSGDSLWSVAEQVAPHSDPREVVSRLVSLNQLESTTLTPGQSLAIPAEYSAR